ncbi:MAG: hypothetical protein HYW62_04375 [Candidatus Levybacteria bacterium]|nr:hypothetical protein [Candidatus Levybacteria bacterium]
MKIPLFAKAFQIAYFLGSLDLSDRLKVAEIVRKELGNVLDGQPTILPIPDDAPLEIPRVILTSKNGEFICNISANRFDFINKLPEGKEGMNISHVEKNLPGIINKLNKLLFAGLNATSYRLGLIINYTFTPKEGGLSFLKSNLLGDENDIASELQMHKLIHGQIKSLKVNNWVRLIAVETKPLLIVSDINTTQTEKYEINNELALAFFEQALPVSLKSIEEVLVKEN